MTKPDDLKVTVENQKITGQHTGNRLSYVKIEHMPTGITVTKIHKIQLRAKEQCIAELKMLLLEWRWDDGKNCSNMDRTKI